MEGSEGADAPINSFSLVAYLPSELAGFVDALRREVEPGCNVRGHITLLPPRPLPCAAADAWSELQIPLQQIQPFRVELADVAVFPVSQVLHLTVGRGFEELVRLHSLLDRGSCRFQETFSYHPHVTLAQFLPPEQIEAARHLAEARWRDFRGERGFLLDRVTLVQNTEGNRWLNLREFDLRVPVPA
jgi:2'-5' RNA ligase